jgi:hypothetical protein
VGRAILCIHTAEARYIRTVDPSDSSGNDERTGKSGSQFMRSLVVVLLSIVCTFPALLAQTAIHAPAQESHKPYDRHRVVVTETFLNANGKLRFIRGYQALYDGSKGDRLFTFSCNTDQYSCRALVTGRTYTQYAGDGSYRCDDYTLASGRNYDFAYVCLDDVHQ